MIDNIDEGSESTFNYRLGLFIVDKVSEGNWIATHANFLVRGRGVDKDSCISDAKIRWDKYLEKQKSKY